MNDKKILCLDFDGVIHDYRDGWHNGEIYGEITPGFFEWAEEACQHFYLIIYSSRSKDLKLLAEMRAWMDQKIADWENYKHRVVDFGFGYASEKPPAWLTIDDRCIRFNGSWQDHALRVENMLAFKPWMQMR